MLAELAALATAVGVLAAVYQLLLSRRQAVSAFEHQFVQRYWDLEDQKAVPVGDDAPSRNRYLRLCEDEYEAMRLAQVSWRTWVVWHDAIREALGEGASTVGKDYEWLRTCLNSHDHSGAFCDGIFAPAPLGKAPFSSHLVTRWRLSPGRVWFLLANGVQRRIVGRVPSRG